jgi:hypothetical protein
VFQVSADIDRKLTRLRELRAMMHEPEVEDELVDEYTALLDEIAEGFLPLLKRLAQGGALSITVPAPEATDVIPYYESLVYGGEHVEIVDGCLNVSGADLRTLWPAEG